MILTLSRAVFGLLVLLSVMAHQPQPAPPPSELGSDVGGTPLAGLMEPDNTSMRAETPEERLHRVYRVTAYCDRGLTAAGVPSGMGQCAAPEHIPFGAIIYIPALESSFVVTDRTAKRFRHNTVDLFIPKRSECKRFGCQYLECEVILPAEPARYGSAELRSTARAVAAG